MGLAVGVRVWAAGIEEINTMSEKNNKNISSRTGID